MSTFADFSASSQIRGTGTKCFWQTADGDCPNGSGKPAIPAGDDNRDYIMFGCHEPFGSSNGGASVWTASSQFIMVELSGGGLYGYDRFGSSLATVPAKSVNAAGRARRWGSNWMWGFLRKPEVDLTVLAVVNGSAGGLVNDDYVTQAVSGAVGKIIQETGGHVYIVPLSGTFDGTHAISVGQTYNVAAAQTRTINAVGEAFAAHLTLMDAEATAVSHIPGSGPIATAHNINYSMGGLAGSSTAKISWGLSGASNNVYADGHFGFLGLIQFFTKGGLATHLSTLGKTYDQWFSELMLYPHLVLERYHPTTGTHKAQATCLWLFGKVTDSDGVEKRPDVRTALVLGDKLVDAIAGYTMILQQASGGTTASVWQYPPFTSPSHGGNEFDLDFAQGNQTFIIGPGSIITTGTVYGNDVEPVNEVCWHNSDMSRSRWPVQVIGGYLSYLDGATLQPVSATRTTRPFPSGKDYHFRSSICALNDGTLILDHCGHNLLQANTPVATYYGMDTHHFTRFSEGDLFTTPVFVDAGGLIGAADTPGGNAADFAASCTTYCHIGRSPTTNCTISIHRSRDTANAFVVARRTTKTTAACFTITTNDGTGIFPAGVLPMPLNSMLICYQTRDASGPLRGLHMLVCSRIDTDAAFATIGNWYNPKDGSALAAAPNSNDEGTLTTSIGTTEDANDSFVASNPLVDQNGNVFFNWAHSTNGSASGVYASDGQPTHRYMAVLQDWLPTAYNWDLSDTMIDIGSIIGSHNTDTPSWSKEETTGTITPTANLGSMWQTVMFQWLDGNREKIIALWADPAGADLQRANTSGGSYGNGVHIGPSYPFQRAHGRKIHAWVIDNPLTAPGTWRYLGVLFNMDALYGAWSAGLSHCCQPLSYLPGYQGSPVVCVQIIMETEIQGAQTKSASAARKYVNVAEVFPAVYGSAGAARIRWIPIKEQ